MEKRIPCMNCITTGACPYYNCKFIHDERLLNCLYKNSKITRSPRKSKEKDIFYWPENHKEYTNIYYINEFEFEDSYRIWNNFVAQILGMELKFQKQRLPIFVSLSKGEALFF